MEVDTVSYASRSLTDVERRYSQTEEALALVGACERFHAYLYGIEFEMLTDHKPLEGVVRYELATLGQLILRGTKLVIPTSLRKRTVQLAHEGHQGIVKTKQRLRTKVWWPGIDRAAEHVCRMCHECQLVGTPSPPEPLKRTELPTGPWQDLAADLLGPMPMGEYLLVVVDYYSRYFEIDVLKSVTSEKVIASMDNMFTTHGLASSVKTDNGPQFVSDKFESYMKNDIEHRRSTPLWPQASSEVERQNRTLLKSMKIAQAQNRDWKLELNKFLTAYRSTPHTTTGVSPAELLFGRKIRTKLPDVIRLGVSEEDATSRDSDVRERDANRKQKGKEYADSHRGTQKTDIEPEERVLMQRRYPCNKLSTRFEHEPYTVVGRCGSEIIVESPEGARYRRNVAHLKKYFADQPRERGTVTVKGDDDMVHLDDVIDVVCNQNISV
ncbi:PREDICTED: uncharacterized protein K02A2.6-like [Priapulus caudatus]|uniref:RNA-directed DNA polymerase n=1 Tax=Priapulus caudatus TaxID=37621 RepID=A0ABM1F115_PRICU|nr:PREDICTED: uncharacterized protein K02A2.6-like [Priapulus caudatus]